MGLGLIRSSLSGLAKPVCYSSKPGVESFVSPGPRCAAAEEGELGRIRRSRVLGRAGIGAVAAARIGQGRVVDVKRGAALAADAKRGATLAAESGKLGIDWLENE